MKTTKKFLGIVASFVLLGSGGIFWYKSQNQNAGKMLEEVGLENDTNTDTQKITEAKETTEVNVQQKTALSNNQIVSEKKLAIIPNRCVGCGKCARLASKNFAMNSNTKKAEVVSQENLTDAKVQKAIEACPGRAITI